MKIAASLQIKGLTVHEDNTSLNNDSGVGPEKFDHSVSLAKEDSASQLAQLSGTKRSQDVQHEPYPIMPKRRHHHNHQNHHHHQPPPPQQLMAELLHQVQSQQQQQQQSHHEEKSLEDHSEDAVPETSTRENLPMPEIYNPELTYQLENRQSKREAFEQINSPLSSNHHNNADLSSTSSKFQDTNNGPDREGHLFVTPLKMGFGNMDIQAAAAAAVRYQMAPNRGAMKAPSSPPSDLSSDSFNLSGNHMEIPTGERLLCLSN